MTERVVVSRARPTGARRVQAFEPRTMNDMLLLGVLMGISEQRDQMVEFAEYFERTKQ